MSTPAAAVLDSANAAPAAVATPPADGSTTPQPAANSAFYSAWDKPEQKDVRDWATNKAFADPFAMAKSARELETSVATLRAAANLKGYPVETKNPDGTVKPVDANARAAWNTTMGVPDSPDKYDIPLPENNPYPQFKGFMAEELHKAGVPAAMAPALAKGYEAAVAKMETQLREQENVQSQAQLLELERAWGTNYQERVALAARGKEWLSKEVGGLNDLQMRTLEAGLGTDKFMSVMWKIGAGNGEARFAGGNGNPPQFGNSVQAAQAELDQLTADRAAGKIPADRFRNRSGELANIIASGMSTVAPN